MELLQLRYFKKVAETGKISAAAKELYISAPALSATLSRLEKELGVKLFDRQANRIVLNQQGEIFLRHVDGVFASLESAKTEMAQSLQKQGGEVRIAVTDAILWRELLSYFTEAYPEIRILATTVPLSRLRDLSLSGRYTFLLAAEGETVLLDPSGHISRGYENLPGMLRSLGADIDVDAHPSEDIHG